MNKNKYEGWTNYETWAVALWIDNDKLRHQCWREAAAEARQHAPTCRQVVEGIWPIDNAARFLLAEWLKEDIIDEAPLDTPTVYSDLLNSALGEVNWQEIADHLLEALAEAKSTSSEHKPETVVVSRYTRAEAIDDGILVDVTETAQEAGIKHPTALTVAVWERYVKVPDGVEGQDEQGRLWDILWMLRSAILGAGSGPTDRLDFHLFVKNDLGSPRKVGLKVVCGPGDDGEPVITAMLPDED